MNDLDQRVTKMAYSLFGALSHVELKLYSTIGVTYRHVILCPRRWPTNPDPVRGYDFYKEGRKVLAVALRRWNSAISLYKRKRGATANEQTSEVPLYKGLWSLAYGSLNLRNLPIPSDSDPVTELFSRVRYEHVLLEQGSWRFLATKDCNERDTHPGRLWANSRLARKHLANHITARCGATANEHSTEAPVCRGLRSLAYRSLSSRNFPIQNTPTSGIVQHDSHLRKSEVNRPGIERGSPWLEARSLTAQPPGSLRGQDICNSFGS
ncbi:hypothetical protein PR048_021859 [Dryococelus australis]|uniref:Uncharacterized protein n=1 Tax=Dryococelus australis TaxID=614101 RepID=A0ABQ9GZF6_9NEOP|nr:hypothetical protein PR048_021859 [Dryococelus australis]